VSGKEDDRINRLFKLQFEMIDRLKAESAATQLLMTGLMKDETEIGKITLAKAFDYAMDEAIPRATDAGRAGQYATLTVGMLDHWRKMFDGL
jgi:hypothetical protein